MTVNTTDSLPSCPGSLALRRTCSAGTTDNLLATYLDIEGERCQLPDADHAIEHWQQQDDDDGLLEQVPAANGQDDVEEADRGDKMVRDRRVLETLVDRGRRFAARQTRRIVHKDGTYNIASQNVTERRRRYLADIFTTLVDMRWRYNVVMFGAAFVLSWTAFAAVWFSIAYAHGDVRHADDEDWQPCVSNVYDFPTALLFSIETQTTIGYGSV